MKIDSPIQGGCACQRVRYSATALPIFVFQCHCRDCQRATGGPYAVNAWFESRSISFSQAPEFYQVTADNGHAIHHFFCRSCGSPLGMERVNGDARGVRAASLDDASWLLPQANIWTCNAYPWETMDPELNVLERQPSEEDWPAIFELQAMLFRKKGFSL